MIHCRGSRSVFNRKICSAVKALLFLTLNFEWIWPKPHFVSISFPQRQTCLMKSLSYEHCRSLIKSSLYFFATTGKKNSVERVNMYDVIRANMSFKISWKREKKLLFRLQSGEKNDKWSTYSFWFLVNSYFLVINSFNYFSPIHNWSLVLVQSWTWNDCNMKIRVGKRFHLKSVQYFLSSAQLFIKSVQLSVKSVQLFIKSVQLSVESVQFFIKSVQFHVKFLIN